MRREHGQQGFLPPQPFTSSMTTPSILLQQPTPAQRQNPDDQLNLMPFAINYEGTAEISKYFITTSFPPPESKDQADEFLESSFRGRYLHGTRIRIPAGYLGLVCSSSPAQSSSSLKLNHPPSPQPIPRATNNLRASSRSRLTTRGRRRARGRKLTQAVGTRTQLKRKHHDTDGFLSDEDSSENKSSKENEAEDDNKLTQSENHESAKELQDNANSGNADAEPPSREAEEDESLGVNQQETRPIIDLPPTSLVKNPETNLPVDTSNDPSHPDGPRIVKPIGSFDQFTIWNPDGPVDLPSDIYARSMLDWVGLAQLLHSIPLSSQ